ncbi:hypothetical protein BDZ45DRAFT_736531 [Acephala macrosclerotiorum]|nr:hypothetical protein BDZ45DRAFT_736531 [Acephala macrosclerotiorum]
MALQSSEALESDGTNDQALNGILITITGTIPTAGFVCWSIAELKENLMHSILLGTAFCNLEVLAYLVLGLGGPNHNFRVYWTWAEKKKKQEDVGMGSYEGLRGDEEEQTSADKALQMKKGGLVAWMTKSLMVETLGLKAEE